MRVTHCLLVELEQLPEIVAREMTLSVLSCVYDTSRQVLLGTPRQGRAE